MSVVSVGEDGGGAGGGKRAVRAEQLAARSFLRALHQYEKLCDRQIKVGLPTSAVAPGVRAPVGAAWSASGKRPKEPSPLFRWRRRSAAAVAARAAPPARPSPLLNLLAISALELSAPASGALLESRAASEWFQLAGHPGSLAPAGPGTVRKRRGAAAGAGAGSYPERDAYEALSACPYMRAAAPRYLGERERDGERYIELQDLLYGFRDPHVMDVKMGTRTFLEDEACNASARTDLYDKMVRVDPSAPTASERAARAVTKLRYMQFRERQSSSAELGFRIEALKLPGEPPAADLQRLREPERVAATLARFLGPHPRVRLLLAARLRRLRDSLERSHFFRRHELVGSSVLIVFDERRVGAWLIDFAKARPVPDGIVLTHRAPWRPGNREEGFLFGLDNLIRAVEEAPPPSEPR